MLKPYADIYMQSLYKYENAEFVRHISGVLRKFWLCFWGKMVVGGLLGYMQLQQDYKTIYKDGFEKKYQRFGGANSLGFSRFSRVYISVHAGLWPVWLASA